MPGELFANRGIVRARVRHEKGLAVGVLHEDGPQGLGVDVGDVKGAHFALTLHQRDHSLFPGNVLTFVGIARLAADVGFIGLDNLIPAADGTALWVNGAFPQAVEEEPRGFIVGAEHARSEEHTSELQSLMRISYAVFCLKKKNKHTDANQQETNSNKPSI